MKQDHKVVPGQIGLLLLVVLGLLMTLVLSLASRSLSDTTLARQEQEQNETFNIAEQGVEEALRVISSGTIPGVTDIAGSANNVSGQYKATGQKGLVFYVKEGETVQIDLNGISSPTLNVLWSKEGTVEDKTTCDVATEGSGNTSAALEVTRVNTTANTILRNYYNPFDCLGLSANNNFASSISGTAFGYVSLANFGTLVLSGVNIVRLRPIYNGATIRVIIGGSNVPDQAYLVQSKATGGDAQKEIQVTRTIDAPGSVFDFALFSGSTIVK